MSTETNPRVVRWQGYTVTQLGFVNNTVLALTTAALGFAVSKGSSDWTQWALWLGIVLLLASGTLALCCAWNRLQDFRESAQLARGKLNLAERRERRRKNRKRSARTWVLLGCQLWTFGLGAACVIGAAVPWFQVTPEPCRSTESRSELDQIAAPGSVDRQREAPGDAAKNRDTP